MLGDARAGRGSHEHRSGGDVEAGGAIATGADDVQEMRDAAAPRPCADSSRITRAAPVISPTVSFFTRRPVMIAAVISGLTSPCMIWRISAIISSWKISRCSIVRCNASCGVMVISRT